MEYVRATRKKTVLDFHPGHLGCGLSAWNRKLHMAEQFPSLP